MKKLLLFLMLLLSFNAIGQSDHEPHIQGDPQQTQAELKAELEKIMQVIESETSCFYERNYDCWKSHWVHEAYTFQAWSNSNGTFDASTGWEAVNERIGTYIKTHPLNGRESSHPKVLRKNMKARFYGDQLAYLVWDQYNSEQDEKQFRYSKDSRIMEKINGQWKIANVTSFWDYQQRFTAEELGR